VDEAVTFYTQAAEAYADVSINDAITTYKFVIESHMENNRFQRAAKCLKTLGGLYEKERNFIGAAEAYEKAADCFQAEDSNAKAHEMLLKVAQFAADQLEYKKAAEIYERVATECMRSMNKLSQVQVPGYLFNATLVQFVAGATSPGGDLSTVRQAADRYVTLCPTYDRSRQQIFLNDLMKAFEDDDVKKFTAVVVKFDRVAPLNDWVSKMLLEVKRVLKAPSIQLEANPNGDLGALNLDLNMAEGLDLETGSGSVDLQDSKHSDPVGSTEGPTVGSSESSRRVVGSSESSRPFVGSSESTGSSEAPVDLG